jgi:hypothetical protein
VGTNKDLNAYAQVGNNGCCSPSAVNTPSSEIAGCCGSATGTAALELHYELTRLLARFDVNVNAASVQEYAGKN